VVYPVLTNEEMTTESQRYNCFTRNGGNIIPKHASPEAKGSSPTAAITLLSVRNPFRGNFNHWQVSRKEAGQKELVTTFKPFIIMFNYIYTGCFKKSFTTLKAYRNLYRGHTQRFELSKCNKTHRVLPRIVMVQCDFQTSHL